MKTILVAALALIGGVFLGGLVPRAELRRVRTELDELKAEVARNGEGGGGLPLGLLLGGGDPGRRPRDVPRFQVPSENVRPQPEGAPGSPAAPTATRKEESEEKEDGPPGDRRRRNRGPFADEQAFAAARAAAVVRAGQFHDAFVDAAHLSPEAVTVVDQAIKNMNEDITRTVNEQAAALRSQGKPITPRNFADVGVKVLETYRKADDQVKATLDPPAQAAAEKTGFDMLTQIDVGAFKSLADSVRQLGAIGPGGRGPLPAAPPPPPSGGTPDPAAPAAAGTQP